MLKQDRAAKLGIQGKEVSNQFLQTAQPVVGLNSLGADEYLPLPSFGFEWAVLLGTSSQHL